MRRFVLGDIHGACKALNQCLERCDFSFDNDQLIFLGDVSDRGPETVECVELLLKVNNIIPLMGNHDEWTMKWLRGEDFDMNVWMQNGGETTIESYSGSAQFESLREIHLKDYYDKLLPYYKDESNRVFVHAGFDWTGKIEDTAFESDYYWDRELFRAALHYHSTGIRFPKSEPYHEIYIGHTPTHRLDYPLEGSRPVKFCNVWCMDQGAGWGGKLSLMNIDSYEIFQSDPVDVLY